MSQKTPLYDSHIKYGGKIVDFAGWEMPINYGSQVEEHHQVRQDAGMFDVSHMTVLDLKGDAVIPFLQYLLSNDVAKLKSEGKALYSCMLNEQGGVIDDLIVYFMSQDWFRMVVNAATRDKDIAWVKRWVDHSALMGAPHIRIFAGNAQKGVPLSESKKLCISAIEECADYAGRKGVFLGIENHGGIVAEARDLLDIVHAVKSPWVGINLDTGNFHSDDPYRDLAACAPYAVNVQVKVVVSGPGGKRVPSDFRRLAAMLTEAGYRGRRHSSACTAALVRDILARGRTPCWSTTPDNVASQRVAERAGFRRHREALHYLAGAPATGALPFSGD